jgi:hypothetical protein
MESGGCLKLEVIGHRPNPAVKRTVNGDTARIFLQIEQRRCLPLTANVSQHTWRIPYEKLYSLGSIRLSKREATRAASPVILCTPPFARVMAVPCTSLRFSGTNTIARISYSISPFLKSWGHGREQSMGAFSASAEAH